MAGEYPGGFDVWDFEPRRSSSGGHHGDPFAYPYRDNILQLVGRNPALRRLVLALYYPTMPRWPATARSPPGCGARRAADQRHRAPAGGTALHWLARCARW